MSEEEPVNPWKKPSAAKQPKSPMSRPSANNNNNNGSPAATAEVAEGGIGGTVWSRGDRSRRTSWQEEGSPPPASPLKPPTPAATAKPSESPVASAVSPPLSRKPSANIPPQQPPPLNHRSAGRDRSSSMQGVGDEPRTPAGPPPEEVASGDGGKTEGGDEQLPEALEHTQRSAVSGQGTVQAMPTSREPSMQGDTMPPPPISPRSRIADLEALLAQRERELHSSREQVYAMQRLQANSSLDAKIRFLDGERAKLAAKTKETEARLHKETGKLKDQLKAKDKEIEKLKHQPPPGQQTKADAKELKELEKRLHEAEGAKASAEEERSVLQDRVKDLSMKVTIAQKALLEKETEMSVLMGQLKRAQAAIIEGADNGYQNEVRLHQARSALHSVLSEVSEVASPSPARDRVVQTLDSPTAHYQQRQQQMQQQQQLMPPDADVRCITSASPPRYIFTYSARQTSSSPYPQNYTTAPQFAGTLESKPSSSVGGQFPSGYY